MNFFIFLVVIAGIIFLYVGIGKLLEKLRTSRLLAREKELTQQGFVAAIKIGEMNGKLISGGGSTAPCVCPFYMYVDEQNKKFAFASPILDKGTVIHGFDDLEVYELFDLDGVDYEKAVKAMSKAALGLAGLATGGLLGGALWGLVGSIAGASAAERMFARSDGATNSYGFMLKINSGNTSYVETYDFFASFRISAKQEMTPLKDLVANPLPPPKNFTPASSLARSNEPYKLNVRNIIKMTQVFDKILEK
ncbi:MAG: hypothetical protein FWE82_07940 [Defluviitaleaceae bacterium]|nr:hypothetical protein [Defluviitaleaceae bacterium]